MATFREGKIVAVTDERGDLVHARVAIPPDEIDAVGFPAMLGSLNAGDRVIVNTTGIELGLGTGGDGFILWNLDWPAPATEPHGHIVKLRYTPWQMEVLAVEEHASAYHDLLVEAESIDGMPVVTCGLHSQVSAAAAGIKGAAPDARVGYLMTDGAALPLAWSNLVRELQTTGLLDVTCSAGHAFGGDLDAVNIFSGLVALCVVGEADVVIAAMGPGIVGTGTRLGFTGMEQGQLLDAAAALGGRGVAALRISFADPRPRHHGVSHHSLTALRLAARERCTVVVPELDRELMDKILAQLEEAGIDQEHDVITRPGNAGLDVLHDHGISPTSMGRHLNETPELFLAASAAGAAAAELL